MTYYPPNQPQPPRRPPMGFQNPQPQYQQGYPQQYQGQPVQYGQWQPPPPKKSYRFLIITIIGAVATLAVIAVVFAMVNSSPDTISENMIKSKVQTIMDQNDIPGSLDSLECPEMTAEKGATYTCVATVDGDQVKVSVTVQDDNGTAYIELGG